MVNAVDAALVLTQAVVPPPVQGIDFEIADQTGGADPAIVMWNTVRLGPQPSAGDLAAVTQAQVDTYYDALRVAAGTALINTDHGGTGKVLRAVAKLVVDEINILREWEVSLQAAVAAATSLADLKTRVAALPTLADRTLAQAKTAIVAALAAAGVD